MTFFQDICALVSTNRGGRGASLLCTPSLWRHAMKMLERASSVAVITGFYVPEAGAPETDGPGGAVVLGRALSRAGRRVSLVTDPLCMPVLCEASARLQGAPVKGASTGEELLSLAHFDLLIYIERLGKNSSGGYCNMRMEDVSPWTAPLDDAIALAHKKSIPVLAVGDGGNEAGMGYFFPSLCHILPDFKNALSITEADMALPVDVSNWGGYGLATLLSFMEGRWLGHSPEEEECIAHALFKAGAVDGVTKKRGLSVDGFPLSMHQHVVQDLFLLWKKAFNSTEKKASGVFL